MRFKTAMRFELDENQIAKYEAWALEQDKIAVEKQKKEIKPTDGFYSVYAMCWEAGHPYYGVMGGSDTFAFTPNSISVIVTVKNSYTNNKLNLTDYDSW